jgi:hypothetical protein
MNSLEPLVIGVISSAAALVVLGWVGYRMIRWAKRRSTGASLLGMALEIPAAGVNPQPMPRIQVEEAAAESKALKNSDASDPKD